MLKKYERLELAESQLETAIGLFVSSRDKLSAITLAGAADVILCRLVINSGKENFTMHSMQQEITESESKNSIESHGREINDTLFINHLKHMDEDEDGYIDINLDECALGAILKALANFVIISGREKDFVKAFLYWVRINLDPKKYNIYCDPDWKPAT